MFIQFCIDLHVSIVFVSMFVCVYELGVPNQCAADAHNYSWILWLGQFPELSELSDFYDCSFLDL